MNVAARDGEPCASLPPNVATTMSGSTSGSLRVDLGRPVEEVGPGQAGRHLVVEFGVDDLRAVEQLLEVRAERAGVAVADDVHRGRVGRPSAGRCRSGSVSAGRSRCHRVDGCGRRGRGVSRNRSRSDRAGVGASPVLRHRRPVVAGRQAADRADQRRTRSARRCRAPPARRAMIRRRLARRRARGRDLDVGRT